MAEPTLFFYDLETSGFDARKARVMQFAGQRTDLQMNPIGEPFNVLIKITPDVLPDPDAILVTGITPQKTLQDGITEAAFLQRFFDEICLPGTTFLGYNTVRFDDEFMRFLLYRNFYDAYEWQWKDECSRWDLLDVVRMTRALRPDGITWPFASDGKPSNRLEFLSTVNKLDHDQAHDALSDVYATIAVAKLIHGAHPDLFSYLYKTRKKDAVKQVVDANQPFVYTSGKYGSDHLSTTVAVRLMPHPAQDAALVYDLRSNPEDFINKSVDELIEHWRFSKDPAHVRLPFKTLKYNRCPAVAPLGVLDEAAQERLELPLATIKKHLAILRQHQRPFAERISQAVAKMDAERAAEQTQLVTDEQAVDARLYEGFFAQRDKTAMELVRAAAPEELGSIKLDADERLQQLLPLYKARNYPEALTADERKAWDTFCQRRLQTGGVDSPLQRFAKRLQQVAERPDISDAQMYLLEELQLYAESIVQFDQDI